MTRFVERRVVVVRRGWRPATGEEKKKIVSHTSYSYVRGYALPGSEFEAVMGLVDFGAQQTSLQYLNEVPLHAVAIA